MALSNLPSDRCKVLSPQRHVCKFPSACLHLFPESMFVLRLVGVLLSFVCGRLRGGCCGPPTAFLVRAPVYRGCLCRDPPVCHRVQGDSVAKRQPFLVWMSSCVHCARFPRVSRDVITAGCSLCANENTYNVSN